MIRLDAANLAWKQSWSANQPVMVGPVQAEKENASLSEKMGLSEQSAYRLKALPEKEKIQAATEQVDGSQQGLAFRQQREEALQNSPNMQNSSVNSVFTGPAKPSLAVRDAQQMPGQPDASPWEKAQDDMRRERVTGSAYGAQSEISAAAKALWRQYIALLAGHPVGPLPMNVINACANYKAAQKVVAA